MSQIRCYKGPAPATPPSGVVTLYAKTDGRWYFKADDGVEYPLKAVGAGTGDLLADGSVPLTANWDVGAYTITALRFVSDVPTGTAPFTVASTTLVANLNADQLDGNEAADFATAAQGATADSALQAADIDSLAELNAIVLDATLGDSSDFATAAQGALADSALQSNSTPTLTNDWKFADSVQLVFGTDNDASISWDVAQQLAITGPVTFTGAVSVSANNNVQTGTTYTIQASDNGKNIIFTNAAAIAVTLPDTLATDFQCTIIQAGTGVPTVTPNTDTINGSGTGVTPSQQWKGMYLTQYQATEWLALL